MRALARPLAVAALALTAAAAAANLAWSKLPWADEVFEIVRSCRQPWTTLIATGDPKQGSAAPLYYLLQKANVESSGAPSEDLLVRYRAVSIAAFALLVGALAATWSRRVSLGSGVVAGLLALSHPYLLWYGAENRPYMLWTALFTVAMLAAAAAAAELPGAGLRTRQWQLGLAAVALSLVATPGFIQGLVLLVTVAAVRRFLHGTPVKDALLPWLPAAVLSAAAGVWYAQHGDHVYRSAAPWDLLVSRDPSLVKAAARLLAPKGQPLTALALVAVAVLVWKVARRHRVTDDAPPAERWLLALTVVAVVQAALALPVAAAVVVRHFHFVPRIFIFLAACHVVLVTCGWTWAARWIAHRRGRAAGSAALAAVVATAAITAVAGDRRALSRANATWPPADVVDCSELSGASAVYLESDASVPDVAVLDAALARYLSLARARRRAGCPPPSGNGVLLLTAGEHGADPGYRILAAPPADARPLDLGSGRAARLR